MTEQKKKQKQNMKKGLIILGVILGISAIVAIRWYIDIANFVSTEDARFSANNVRTSSKISGKVIQVLVQECDHISSDAVLAILDQSDLEINLKQARNNYEVAKLKYQQIVGPLNRSYNSNKTPESKDLEDVEVAKNKVELTQIALNTAKDNLIKYQTLFNTKAISKNDLQKAMDIADSAQKNFEIAKSSYSLILNSKSFDIKTAIINIDQAKNALDLAETNYNNTYIRTPLQGIIALKTVNTGEYVSPGQTLFTIINPQDIWVQANIKESDVYRLKLNTPCTFYADIYPHKAFKGVLSEIGIATNSNFSMIPLGNTGGTFVKIVQNIPVKIKITDTSIPFQVGTSVKVKIKTK